MIAPSEKHLEDWIVNNFNRFGCLTEQELVPEYAREGAYCPNDEYYVDPFFSHLVARQLPLPCGRPDLIAFSGWSLAAIEIKKGSITHDVIGQCLRYIHELRQVFSWVVMDVFDDPDRHSYLYRPLLEWELTDYPEGEITGMVVGHSVSDKNIPLVCAAAGIVVVTYDYSEGEYLFERHYLDLPDSDNYRTLVNGRVGQFLRLAMKRRAERFNRYDARVQS